MAPRRAVVSPLMVLQAFVDDSYKPNGFFVLGGYVATAEQWALFAADWEEMLPYGTRAPNNQWHFKMSEMALNEERLRRVPAFLNIIDKYDITPISACINLKDLEAAIKRIFAINIIIDKGAAYNPYMIAFKLLMEAFHGSRQLISMIPGDEPVNFIFDEQAEKNAILRSWDEYRDFKSQNNRWLFGATPRFEDDKQFLPLQAADFQAWAIRRWYEEGLRGGFFADFFKWRPKNQEGYIRFMFELGEDLLVENLIADIKCRFPRAGVYDSKYRPFSA
jgi:hypothetical protein